MNLTCLLVAWALAMSPATGATTQSDDSARQIAAWAQRIPRLTMTAEGPDRFEVSGTLAACRFRVVRVADRASLFFEGLDGTPLLISADHQSLWYDSFNARLVHFPKSGFNFELGATEDSIKIDFGISFSPKEKSVTPTIDIDVGSLLRTMASRATIERQGNTTAIVKGRGEAADVDVVLAPDAELILRRMLVKDLKSGRTALSVEHVMLGDTVEKARLDFPTMDAFRAFNVHVAQPVDKDAAKDLLGDVIKSLTFRMALHEPEMRKQFDKEHAQLDWNSLAEVEARMARQLRAVPRQGAAVTIDLGGR